MSQTLEAWVWLDQGRDEEERPSVQGLRAGDLLCESHPPLKGFPGVG
jgi:hypothetical protein